MDGSQKLPQRLLHTVRERRAAGAVPTYAALAVAAWMRFVQGVADNGAALALDDPLAEAIRAALPSTGDPAGGSCGACSAWTRSSRPSSPTTPSWSAR